uniref:MULE transposase domain-containing protein n=1 Tax=Latimeria chalumnae TaxID=7897 RepID=H3A3N7_LATCH
MNEIGSAPGNVQGTVSAMLSNDVLMSLPKKPTFKRKETETQRHWLGPPPKDKRFEFSSIFQGFVLYDSGVEDPHRLIILGCMELLDGLARADVWLADGTFKVVPLIFFQQYTIHFQYQPGIIPAAVYCLLPNKTQTTYDHLLQVLTQLVPAASPKQIPVDFESAAMSAFRKASPDATLRGCYFHLCQSVIRKIQEIGMKESYERDPDFSKAVLCLPVLSRVPKEDIQEAF